MVSKVFADRFRCTIFHPSMPYGQVIPHPMRPATTLFQVPSPKAAIAAVLLLAGGSLCAQPARLVLNNGGWVRIDNGAWVVVMNSAPTGIQTLGTGGNLRSEGEFNRVRWNIQNQTGTYVLPYTNTLGNAIPFTCQVTGAGTGTGNASLTFSTYNHRVGANTWDNDLYRPSDVTHMNNWDTGVEPTPIATNESGHVVDRFWMVDYGTVASTAPYAYGTPPTVTLGFTYIPTDDVQPGNIITAATPLGAQRFNAAPQLWGDLAPGFGTWAAGSVTNVAVPTGHFFRSWTLSDLGNPLPVELVQFASACEGGRVTLTWVTASEQNNEAFIIERSTDNVNFEAIGTVAGAGHSFSPIHYSFVDHDPPGLAYYRLRQMDTDGRESLSWVSVAGCDDDGITTIVNAWDDGTDLNVVVSANGDQDHLVRLFDAGGKEVWNRTTVALPDGLSTVRIPKQHLAMGVYVVRFDGPEGPMARRVALH